MAIGGTQWEDVALPILEQVLIWEDDESREQEPTTKALSQALDKPVEEIGRQLIALEDDRFLSMSDIRTMGHPFAFMNIRLRPRGRRVLGEWPGEPAEEFLRALDRLIAAATDSDERGKLEKLKSAAGAVSIGAFQGAVGAAVQGAI